ncbi:beta-3-deoxy-D-manno-oct-2-ulosonic acid transferase [Orrella marina]|uniref:Beta-3-deoxy-D-manno-oct-2-ulosonic acid transferase n=1 Tax=Orrella marina TaxID=2163011 RepID=A0A2R4XP24_9BURK|nr:beta-3-deoxy-D-manno-oct-2-ulosonic acid transferase [Orrella marina]
MPYWKLEDGFLRSFGTGRDFPSISMVVDRCGGIYYDSTQPSELEQILQSDGALLDGREQEVGRAVDLIVRKRLSKYNNGGPVPDVVRDRIARHRLSQMAAGRGVLAPVILLIDQTFGDVGVTGAGANEQTFARMVQAARATHPDALLVIKTHPEVSAGHKSGYFSHLVDDERTVCVRERVEPFALLTSVDEVYTVSSQMGFEALLAGKPVRCFGLPWYAGWGVTRDEQTCSRRTRTRSVQELFAAAYLDYTRYIDPETGRQGSIFDAIEWLIRQKEHAARFPARVICVGFKRWRQSALRPLLSLHPERLHFVRNASAAQSLNPRADDTMVFWGASVPAGLSQVAESSGARLCHLEDGFIRSVGLGTDRVRPQSLVFDPRGLYFDPHKVSTLEQMLNTVEVSDEDLERAKVLQAFIVKHRITKYNLEPDETVRWPGHRSGQAIILVPGQVADDASVRLGAGAVNSNPGLLQAARKAHPDAYIVYKPHPDVASGNRKGGVSVAQARQWANHVETQASIISCIEACTAVHTLTSLSGFDALLRGKEVVVYGRPFYSGWGLTQDMVEPVRPRRRRTLPEMIAICLLHYPMYWNWKMRGASTCEAVMHRLYDEKRTLQASGMLERLRSDRLLRFCNKARSYWLGWFPS